ncbi:MAG TPA: hypothetical protein PKL65_02535 [Bacteroidales bacterium]|jgi:hypothetical protein|nr:hypothetical protein [Bacteroidales bacterium]HNR41083.1 hypothetical protein [Bacteroidales bacterium]HPM18206.1 hypothetical protein [Bacteroidales bacterium]HQG77147.1 hypothetical protein [Bacteroidales bacterium]
MKRNLLLTVVALLAFLTGSCTKDDIKLSEFVVGTWKSQEINLGGPTKIDMKVTLIIVINENKTYVLSMKFSEGGDLVSLPQAEYVLDESRNQITIKQPEFEPVKNSEDSITFEVEWEKGSKKMTWTPLENPEAPTLIWTKQKGPITE